MMEHTRVLDSPASTDTEKLPSSPETAHFPGSSLTITAAPMISSPVCASITFPRIVHEDLSVEMMILLSSSLSAADFPSEMRGAANRIADKNSFEYITALF